MLLPMKSNLSLNDRCKFVYGSSMSCADKNMDLRQLYVRP